jgi:MFS family permease
VSLVCVLLAVVATAYLAWRPMSPLWLVMVVLATVGTGVGSVFPLTTVCIQNSVELHQMGTATGVMNFFRALFASLVVAIMGAIMLAGFGVAAGRGQGAETLTIAGAAASDAANVFRWVFAAGAAFLAVGLVALIRLPERPLRGGSGRAT